MDLDESVDRCHSYDLIGLTKREQNLDMSKDSQQSGNEASVNADGQPCATAPKPRWSGLRRFFTASLAVIAVYWSGFLWEEVSPAAYSVIFLIIASSPLLLKISFWKKLVLIVPLLLVRVIGKLLIKMFGLKAMERLFERYGLLERRFNNVLAGFNDTKANALQRWRGMFRLLQFLVEKGMSSGIERVSQRIVEKRQNENTKVDCTEANDKTPSGDER